MPIDTSTINENYPVAGQSNSTQGFRDNFSAIKTLLGELDQAIEALSPGALATVATTGDYDDLSNKPTLFSGDYADLTNKPLPADAAGALTNNGTGTLTWEPIVPAYRGNYTVVNAQTINVEFSVGIITTATSASLPVPAEPGDLEGVEITLVKESANTTTTVVTVPFSAWSGGGTVTFTDAGQTCTLINVNEKWYVKAVNGAVIGG